MFYINTSRNCTVNFLIMYIFAVFIASKWIWYLWKMDGITHGRNYTFYNHQSYTKVHFIMDRNWLKNAKKSNINVKVISSKGGSTDTFVCQSVCTLTVNCQLSSVCPSVCTLTVNCQLLIIWCLPQEYDGGTFCIQDKTRQGKEINWPHKRRCWCWCWCWYL